MSKTIEYTVHSAAVDKIEVETMFRDRPTTALVDGLTVELVGAGEHDGHGHTFRFVPVGEEEMTAHKDLFVVGNHIRVTFEAIQPNVEENH